jgi:hypothetical protein
MTDTEEAASNEAAHLAGQFLVPIRMESDAQAEVSCLRLANLIKHVRELERSECAKVCEEVSRANLAAHDCAAAIRARSQP